MLTRTRFRLRESRSSSFKQNVSPCQSFTLKGQVQQIYLGGKLAYDKDRYLDGFSSLRGQS